MTLYATYADVEQLLVGWVPTVVSARAVTELPADLTGQITSAGGVVRVTRIGGPAQLGFDSALVDTDCFASTRTAAKALAILLSTKYEFALPGFTNTYGGVLTVDTVSGPSWRPWENTDVRRFGMTHRFTVQAR